MSKKCIYCGAELEDDALFCDECGKKQELAKEPEVEQKARKEAELKAKQEADVKAKAEADAIAEAAQKAKEEGLWKRRFRAGTKIPSAPQNESGWR